MSALPENFTEQLQSMLGDPKTMEQVSALAKMLGNSGNQNNPQPPPLPQPAAPNLTGLRNLLGSDPQMLQTVGRLLPMLQASQQEDNATRFLHSLRPMLSAERQQRLDNAEKLLRLFRLLPLLRGQGIF